MKSEELEKIKKNQLRNMILNGQRKDLHKLLVDVYGELVYHGSVISASEIISFDIGAKVKENTIRKIREKKLIKNQFSTINGEKGDPSDILKLKTDETALTEKADAYDPKMEYLKNFKPVEPNESDKEVRISGLRF